MPHIIVKLWPGRSEELKQTVAKKLAEEAAKGLNSGIENISVSFEEIPQEEWKREVYKKDILDKPEQLYVKPGYSYTAEECE